MPALIFPAPGCADGQRFPDILLGFDILSSSGGTFVNLLRNSNDLSKSSWIKGSAAGPTTANYDVVDWYVSDNDILPFNDLYVLSNGFGDNLVITSTSTAYIGQVLTVSSNTRYTASFFAKRGSATNMSYGVYDRTNSSTIVAPTSYYNQTTSTYTKITFSFTTNPFTSEIVFYPLWTIASGSPGSVNIAAPQVQIGNTSTGYNATLDTSFAALGIPSVVKQSYGITRLSTFTDPAINFDSIGINGQSKVKWNVVNDYIFDSNFLTYSSRTGNNVLDITDFGNRPYNVGDTVTISNQSPVYRQSFTVTSFTPTTITINTTATIPYNGALLTNPTPSVYPADLEYINLLTYKRGVTQITKGRQALYLSTLTPNNRAVTYSFENRQFADLRFSSMGITKSLDRLRQTSISYQPGKVNPLNFFKEVAPNRLPTKIQRFKTEARTTPRENRPAKLTSVIRPREVAPRRLPNVIQSFTTATGFLGPNPVGSWPSGIYRFSNEYLNGIVLIIDPVFLPGGGMISTPQFENIYRLESFDNQGIYIGPTVGVVGTDNIKNFDTVNDYIYDYDFTATNYIFPSPGYLYFNPEQTDSLQRTRFPIGSYVKISNTFTGYSEVTMVLESNLNNILVTLAPEFPNNYLGGTTIQDASPFYYPKEKVAENLFPVQLPIVNVDSPRNNLFYSEYRPLIPGRTVVYTIDRAIGNDTIDLSQTTKRLELFQLPNLPGDFPLSIVGQNTEQIYPTVNWYINDRDIFTATTVNSLIKTIYFPEQGSVVFASGSTVRVTNSSNGYNKIFAVITGTNSSVTILDPNDFPAGTSTIEQTVTSVYPRLSVKPLEAPKNARENLYYFELAPGLRGQSAATVDSVGRDLTVAKVNAVTRLIPSVAKINTNKVNAADRLKAVTITVTTTATYMNRVESLTSQTSVRLTTRPITPAERFYYFNLAPGYRNNGTYSYGRTFAADNTQRSFGKLRSVSPVKSDGSRFRTATINKPLVKLTSDDTRFRTATINKQLLKLVSVISSFKPEKIKFVAQLRADKVIPAQFLAGAINNPIRFRSDTNQVFLLPQTSGQLAKQLFKLTSNATEQGFLTTGKLRSVSPVRGDGVRFRTENINKSLLKLVSVDSPFKPEKLRFVSQLRADKVIPAQFLAGAINNPIRFRSDTNQLFFTPNLGKLQSISPVKGDGVIFKTEKIKFVSQLRADPQEIKTALVDKFKVPSLNTEIFYTPTSANLNKQLFKTQLFFVPTSSNLNKQLFKLVTDQPSDRAFAIGKLRSIDFLKGDKIVFNPAESIRKPTIKVTDIIYLLEQGNLEPVKFKFNTNEVLYTPGLGKLRSVSPVKGDGVRFRPEVINKPIVKLASVFASFKPEKIKFVSQLRGDKVIPAQFLTGAITKFKFSVLYSQVFFAPTSSNVAAAIRVKADGNRLVVNKLSAAVRVKEPANRPVRIGITDNYFDQSNYSAITAPNSPAAWYRYSVIAQGFRSNSTYNQGRAFAPDNTTITSSRLSTFDNEGIIGEPFSSVNASTDPRVSVTGRTSQFTNDAVLWYIEDRDVLTVLPVGTPTITLYFSTTLVQTFAAGNRIRIYNGNVIYGRDVTVLSATDSSVTILELDDFPSISGMTIQRIDTGYDVSVFFNNSTTLIPYVVGSFVRITNNNNSSYITVPVTNAGTNFITYTKTSNEFYVDQTANATIASASVSIYPRASVRTTVPPTRPRESLFYAELARGYRYGVVNTPFGSSLDDSNFAIKSGLLERDSLRVRDVPFIFLQGDLQKDSIKVRPPVELFFPQGNIFRYRVPPEKVAEAFKFQIVENILRLKTGDFKTGSTGIIDVAAPKKEPIQFWN